MAAGLLLAGLSTLGLAIAMASSKTHRTRWVEWVANPSNRMSATRVLFVLGGLSWVAISLPAYRLEGVAGYMEVLRPVFVLIGIIAAESILFVHLDHLPSLWARLGGAMLERRSAFVVPGVIAAGMIMTVLLIVTSRVGLEARGEDFWYETGVPLLAGHIVLAVGAGLLLAALDGRIAKSPRANRIDLALFLAIWCAAALTWTLTPAPNGYFNPGPFPPDNVTYPFSDAAVFDLRSQFALIGQALNNGKGLNRPAYPAFLVLIHTLAGQDFDRSVNWQAAFFGVFPALVFLIGRSLLHRGAGMAAAVLMLLRGVSSLSATNLLNLSNPKQMLSDFPTGIGVALGLYLCVQWFKHPEKKHLPLLAGGAIAFSIYLRPNALGVLMAVVLLVYFAYLHLPKKWMFAALALFLAGYVALTTPWEVREEVIAGGSRVYPSSLRKVFGTLRDRFPDKDTTEKPENRETGSWKDGTQPTQRWNWRDEAPPLIAQADSLSTDVKLDPGIIANHFFHNIVTSVMTLPSDVVFHDLRTTIKAENSPWRSDWDGGLPAPQSVLFGLNLAWVGLGVATVLRRNAAAGLLPLGFFLCYHITNAVARTSGGRYIVPVDWIVGLYFVFGLMQGAVWLFRLLGLEAPALPGDERPAAPAAVKPDPWRSVLRPALGLFLAGTLLVLPDFIFPQTFEQRSNEPLVSWVISNHPDLADRETLAYIDQLMENNARAFIGKILYPRFAKRNAAGELFSLYTGKSVQYPLVDFTLMGPDGHQAVHLAGPLPDGITHYVDAVVIGCRQDSRIEAVVVILDTSPPAVLTRRPFPPPQCPIPEPVCDNNGNCQQ